MLFYFIYFCFLTLKWHLAPLAPSICFSPSGQCKQTSALVLCDTAVSSVNIFILYCGLPLYCIHLGQLGLFCMQMPKLVIFLPSWHSIVWGKEKCGEEVKRAGKVFSALVEGGTWHPAASLEPLIQGWGVSLRSPPAGCVTM